MTAGCGLAHKFWQLALARMGVGVGEAALSPSAYSLIADYFPPARRSTALGVYGMGIYIGSGLALILGGLVQQLMPNTLRGQASAIYLFVVNLIGLGLGPTLVATLTQDVFQDKNAVHLSLLVTGVFAQVCAAVLLWRGLKHYRRSLDYLSAWSKANA